MGKTPRPLTFLVSPELSEWPEFAVLRAQGHVIGTEQDVRLANLAVFAADLILAPNAWRMDHRHRKYLAHAVAAARKVRYPKEDK